MMKHFLLLLLFIPSLALAKVELFQIVVFDWDDSRNALQLVSLGSGTAVSNDLILTNKHVVQTSDGDFADLLLLCQAQAKAGDSVKCDIAAGVSAAHPDEDVALVKPLESQFFPQVRVSYQTKRSGDSVRVFGFPAPTENKLGFGDNKTLQAFNDWVANPSQPLKAVGDKLTVTRGEVQTRLQNSDTGFTYTKTDAKVNFGNSGGAAFDEYGDYLGIITYKDQSGNSIFLEYHQIDDWVKSYQDRTPIYTSAAYDFYKSTQQPVVKKTVQQSSLESRLRALRDRRVVSKPSVRAKKVLTPTQQRLYDYLRQKRLEKDRISELD